MNTETANPEVKQLHELEIDRQICQVRFSHDGNLLLGGGYDASIRRWDFSGEQPQEIGPMAGHRGWVQNLIVHPSEEWLISADSWGQIRCTPYAGETPEARWSQETAHDGWVRSIGLTADGSKLVSGGRDQLVKVWDVQTSKLLHTLAGHEYEVWSVAIHPDGKSVVSGDLMGNLKHWDLEKGKCVREFDLSTMHFFERDHDVCGLRILEFLDEGKTLLCAGSEPTKAGRSYGFPTAYLYDWESGEKRVEMKQGADSDGYIFDLARHPDGFWMLATSGTPGTGKLFFRREAEEEPFLTYTKMSNCHSLALHPSKNLLVVTATNRSSQGNGAVRNEDGSYKGNYSPLYVFEIA